MDRTGVAALIVGNEVLTGKVLDQNGPLLVAELRAKSVPLRGIATVPDDVDAIMESFHWARRRAPVVITSGGIGPTHDDVTVRAVARALRRELVRLPEMVELLSLRGVALTPEALRLAEAPEGTQLIPTPGSWLPTLACDGVFLLPGVPPLFALQLQAILPQLPRREVFLRTLFLRAEETAIAPVLERLAREWPDLDIGSYPQWDTSLDHRVQVTVEGAQPDAVEAVAQRLTSALAEVLVRSE